MNLRGGRRLGYIWYHLPSTRVPSYHMGGPPSREEEGGEGGDAPDPRRYTLQGHPPLPLGGQKSGQRRGM